MYSNFKSQFISGVIWTFSSNLGTTIISFSLGVWLSRILGPEVYGVLGMALIITGFSYLLLDFGFGEALIQQKVVHKDDYSTIFWYNIIFSLILCITVYSCANLIGDFYNNDSVVSVSKAISLVIIINSIGLVPRIRLEKEMRFKEIGIAEVLSSLISTLLAIGLALKGFGIWSLVFLHLFKPLLYVLVIWLYSRWIPSFVFSFKSIKKLLKFSFAIFLNGVFNTIANVLDKLLIGRNLGEFDLGIYAKSKATVRMPVKTVMSAIGRVIYPAFSKIHDDNQRVFNIYIQFINVITCIVFPSAIIFYVFGSNIINLVFGLKWVNMIPIFKLMSLGIVVLPFNILIDSVVKSSGNVKYLNFITFYEKPITIICLIIGVYFGDLYFIAIMVNLALFINFFFKSYIMTLVLKVSYIKLLKNHLYCLKFLFIPLVGFYFLSLTNYWNHLVLKLITLLVTFVLSFFIFRKELSVLMIKFYGSIKSKNYFKKKNLK